MTEVQVDEVVDGVDLYGPDADEGRYTMPEDPISAAVGSPGYMAGYVVDDCVERFADGSWRDAERFDRFYWEPEPVLIDLLQADTDDEKQRQREAKNVEFKARWCAENGRRYVVLHDSDTYDPARLDELLAPAPEAPHVEPEPAPKAKTPARPRARKGGSGQVQRPRRKS